MAQTVPPPPSLEAPRPLPRRPPSAVKASRPPRLVPLDGVWAVALALASAGVSASLPHPAAGSLWLIGTGIGAMTTVLVYLLGWRARDRAAGVIAGLLLATSLPFAQHAAAPRDALLALLTVASLLSFVAGSSLLALTLAGLASVARPDAVLLGVVLLGLALAQRRRFAALGAGLFLVFAGAGWATLHGLGHQTWPVLHIGARYEMAGWAVAPGMAFVTWMLLPFCAELGEGPRRARWLSVVLCAAALLAVPCFIRIGGPETTLPALLPLWFVMAGGGLSRLLPALIGEIPLPWARYLLATAAVLSLLALRFSTEKHLLRPAAVPAVLTAPAAPVKPTLPARPLTPTAPAIPVHVVPVHQVTPAAPVRSAPKTVPTQAAAKPKAVPAKPKAVASKPQAPSVPLYVRRNGRLVRRSSWAIAWDKAHLRTH